MCEVECTISYCLWPPRWETSARAATLKEIGYQVRVGDDASRQNLEGEIVAQGISEIRLVEGADAAYEVVDVRSIVVDMPLPWH